jgi:predicted transcriptional regulator
MTDDVKEILRRVESWPEEDQEELASVARLIEARRSGVYQLSDEERAAVRKGMDAARRGEFAADEDIERFYQLHRTA